MANLFDIDALLALVREIQKSQRARAVLDAAIALAGPGAEWKQLVNAGSTASALLRKFEDEEAQG